LVRQRRARLLIRREDAQISGDPTFSDADWRASVAETDRELAQLEHEREEVVRGAQDEAHADVTLRWLSGLSSWTEVLDLAPERAAARNEIYRQCIGTIDLDFGADTITVHWLPPIARLLGRGSDALSLKGA
jgi:hypothetical protein